MRNLDTSRSERFYSFKCGVASFAAKYVVAIFHPLDLLKTRLQSHDGKVEFNHVPQYKSAISGLKNIYRQQGIRGLYKGVHLSTFISAFSSSCFFYLYEKRKLSYQQQDVPTMHATIIAGTQASIFAVLVTQPVWVVKTRVLLNTHKKISEFQNVKQKTLEIWRQQRFKGFMKGFSLNIFLSFGGALRVYTYEGSKILFEKLISENAEGVKYFVCGGISKLITTLLSYPFSTIRTRIQQNQYFEGRIDAKYKNLTEIAQKIAREEGFVGFYKGLLPSLVRAIPMRSVYFYSYQLFKSVLIDKESIEMSKKKEKSLVMQ